MKIIKSHWARLKVTCRWNDGKAEIDIAIKEWNHYVGTLKTAGYWTDHIQLLLPLTLFRQGVTWNECDSTIRMSHYLMCFVPAHQLIHQGLLSTPKMNWRKYKKRPLAAMHPDNKVHGANRGPACSKWAPCCPHEPCYKGMLLLCYSLCMLPNIVMNYKWN